MSEAYWNAVRTGDVAAVREALAGDASLASARDASGVSALLVALYHRQPEVAAEIAATATDLDVFEAAATGRVDRLGELLAADAGLANAYATDGFFPLGLAAFFGQAEAVDALLAAGADPNAAARNATVVRAIHAAAAASRADIAGRLLAAGADPDARQQAGFTPLHEAARGGKLELARALLAAGADPALAADDGRTALDFARDGGHDDVAALISDHQSRPQ
jgi:ankyrin repeat protein